MTRRGQPFDCFGEYLALFYKYEPRPTPFGAGRGLCIFTTSISFFCIQCQGKSAQFPPQGESIPAQRKKRRRP